MLRKNFFAVLLSLSTGIIFLSSCGDETSPGWEYMPDMYRGPALEAHQPYGYFADSLSARKPVEGTVPRGFMTYQSYSPLADGYEAAKANLTAPASIKGDSANLAEGAELYAIFCTHCHGDKGDGQGILMKRDKIAGIPSYADRDINMGTIFHVVTYGKGIMGSHASQLTPEERWKVAYHVLKLKRELSGAGEEAEQAEQDTAAATEAATAEEVMDNEQNQG